MQRDPSDAKLVMAERQGDKEAFAVLVGRHRPLLLALCQRMLNDPMLVEDAMQQAIVQALLGIDRLRRPESFGSWLGGIGLNVCRRLLSERAHQFWSWEALVSRLRIEEQVDGQIGPAELAEQAEVRRLVRHAVAALPRGQRHAVMLFYLSGLTHEETAAKLGIGVGAVKTRLHKTRGVLHRGLWTEWREEQMATAETGPMQVEVRVDSLRKNPEKGTFTVVLKEVSGPRYLLIFIDQVLAEVMADILRQTELPRPLTCTVISHLIDALNGKVREVRITKLVEDVCYAVIVVDGPKGIVEVDARPSDGINIALTVGAPLNVENAVLNAAGIVIDTAGKVRRVADNAVIATVEVTVDAAGMVHRADDGAVLDAVPEPSSS
jgi:RNA polymerase sigma factor (sigma-70 family)